MINLKEKGLPNAIEVNGQAFLVNTNFRVWLDYPNNLQTEDGSGYVAIFRDNVPMPSDEVMQQLDLFYRQPSELPRCESKAEPLIDWDMDADYVYAAFMQAYGIDLVDADLHWHKFIALFHGLPADTYILKIMEYRSYEGDDKELIKLRQAWSLPSVLTDEEKQAVDEFNELFG